MPKKPFFVKFFSQLIVYILVLQIGLPTSLILTNRSHAAQGEGDGAPETDPTLPPKIAPLVVAANSASETATPPIAKDPDLLTRQGHKVYRLKYDDPKDGQKPPKRVLVTDYPFTNPTIENPAVGFTGLPKVIYNPETHEIEFITANSGLVHVHSISGIELATTATHFLSDENMLIFATNEGIRVIFVSDFIKRGYKASVLAPLVVPFPVNFSGKIKITKLEFLTRQSEPRALVDIYGVAIAPDARLKAGDLSITIQDESGNTSQVHIPREEIIKNYRLHQLHNLALLQLASPDLDAQPVLQQVLAASTREIQASMDAVRAVTNETPDLERASPRELDAAIRCRAQHVDACEECKLFVPDPSTQRDAFQTLAQAPRDTFLADPSGESVWAQAFQANLAKEVAFRAAEAAAQKEQKGALKRVLSRIKETYNTYATPKRVRLLAAALAGVALDGVSGWHMRTWFVSMASQVLDIASTVPVIHHVTDPLKNSLSYFADGMKGLCALGGLTATIALVPLSMLLARSVASLQKKDWGLAQSAFNYGLRIYAYINYPILQKLLWKLTGQKLVYPALDNHVNPFGSFENAQAVFHLPSWLRLVPGLTDGVTQNIQDHTTALNELIENEGIRKSLATLLAAKAVAQNGQVDIATLLMMQSGEKIELFAGFANNPALQARWIELTKTAYGLLSKLDPETIRKIKAGEAPEIERLEGVYQEIERNCIAAQSTPGMRQKAATTIARLGSRMRAFLLDKALPFVFFGKQWLDLYRKFRAAVLDPESTAIAIEQYLVDYMISTVYYAGMDDRFAQVVTLGKGGVAILGDQGQQIGLYSATLPPEVLTSQREAGAFQTPDRYQPVSTTSHAGDFVRAQTVGEGINAIATGEGINPLANHARQLELIVCAFQAYVLLGAFSRFAGSALNVALGENPASLLSMSALATLAGSALMKEAYLLISKRSFFPASIPFGYATVWPYIQAAMRLMKGSANANRARILAAVTAIEQGNELKDSQMISEGVKLLKDIFEAGKLPLPNEFQINSSLYSFDLAKQLVGYTKDHVPLPTEDNQLISRWILNAGVAAVSTMLYMSLSKLLWGEGFSPTAALPNAILWFTLSWAGLKAAAAASGPVVRTLRSVVSTCADYLTKVSGSGTPQAPAAAAK